MRKLLIFALILSVSCTKKNNSPTPDVTPGAATLSSPASNSTCTVGTVVSANVSTVLFTWAAGANAQSYDITVKNLLDNTSVTQTTTANQLQLNLNRNTPYGWYVVSKSSQSSAIAKSEVWKFYNSGIATSSYAPFPADLILPTYGQAVNANSGKVTLTWNGADVDNDITSYDVYLGTSVTNLATVKSSLVPATFDVTVTSGTSYYWKIVTHDSQANTSTSATYQFKVN